MKKEKRIAEWKDALDYITERSEEICKDNGCTEEEHFCESNAYITGDGTVHDVSPSDFFQGWGSEDIETWGHIAVVSLPFVGDWKELKDAVEDDIAEQEART